MKPQYCLAFFGLVGAAFTACGPDAKPGPPCGGPTYNLIVATDDERPLPADTRLNVRYGGNHEGEAYELSQTPSPQAVFCTEHDSPLGGAPSVGGASNADSAQGGAATEPAPGNAEVWALVCRLYTQGPARIDVTASGYEPIEELELTLDERDRDRVERLVELKPLLDAGT